MILTREEVVTETRREITGFVCDCCGDPISTGDAVPFRYTGGWDSPVVGDMTSWSFEVCERCLQRWVETFKHPIRVGNELNLPDRFP